jgi:Flp pilus assembly protein TadG
MTNHHKTRPGLKAFLRDERGIAAIYMAICLPVFMGFAALAVQGSYMISQRNMLQVTAEVAALAATAVLPDPSAAVSTAQSYAAKNMPSATYGDVLASGDIILGTWTQGCTAGGQSCFAAGATPYNAVKVTTRRATAAAFQASTSAPPPLPPSATAPARARRRPATQSSSKISRSHLPRS